VAVTLGALAVAVLVIVMVTGNSSDSNTSARRIAVAVDPYVDWSSVDRKTFHNLPLPAAAAMNVIASDWRERRRRSWTLSSGQPPRIGSPGRL